MRIRYADHVTPLYPQKLALTSPTGGGSSVGIVRSRTKATEEVIQCWYKDWDLPALRTRIPTKMLTRFINQVSEKPSVVVVCSAKNRRYTDSWISSPLGGGVTFDGDMPALFILRSSGLWRRVCWNINANFSEIHPSSTFSYSEWGGRGFLWKVHIKLISNIPVLQYSAVYFKKFSPSQFKGSQDCVT